MPRLALIGVAALAIVLGLVATSAMFTVHQTQQVLVLRFGDPLRVVTEPGLAWKVPLVDQAIFLEKRILYLDAPPQEVIAADQKRLVVDAFARYRITDPLLFFQSVSDQAGADSRIATMLDASIRRVLGEATFEEIVRDERPDLMRRITSQVNAEVGKFGMMIVDARLRGVDLPEANSQAIYSRMQTEREREAADIRARGQEESLRIRARADREVRVIEAEARREGEVIRGEGDGERNRIYAEAYGSDREFFSFYRSMEAYDDSLGGNATRLILSPDSVFFRYFRDRTGGHELPAPVPAEPD